MNLHGTHEIKTVGKTSIYQAGSGKIENINLDILNLQEGDVYDFPVSISEQVIILLTGSLLVSLDGEMNEIGGRSSVFEGPAAAIYVGAGNTMTVEATSKSEMAIVSTNNSTHPYPNKVITPDNVIIKDVGKHHWRRTVHTILPGDFPADKLIIGETFNDAGAWSSSPPHKHDREKLPDESKFEELYFYRVEPVQGFGIQRVYSDDHGVDECYTVKYNDHVEIPFGYHPVVAGPNYRLYYLWILVGEGREPVWFEDPNHSWINEL